MPVNPSELKFIIYEKRDRKAYITLNRPEAMNALSPELIAELKDCMADYQNDDDLLCAIVTGAGGRAFSAGADLKAMAGRNARGERALNPGGGDGRITGPYWNFKPIIAAIDGYCLAGGMETALECDIRIASAKSSFGLPEPRRSLLAGPGLHNLSRIIPLGNAMYIQLTGMHVSAEFALRSGFIQEILPDREAVLARADEIADEILKCAPLAVSAIKRIVMLGRYLTPEMSIRLAEPIQAQIGKTEDAMEGPKAFAEKRQPVWKMR